MAASANVATQHGPGLTGRFGPRVTMVTLRVLSRQKGNLSNGPLEFSEPDADASITFFEQKANPALCIYACDRLNACRVRLLWS